MSLDTVAKAQASPDTTQPFAELGLKPDEYASIKEILIPLKNGEGAYMCDDETLTMLEGEGRIIARYVGENPNGSRNLIAGVTNERGNVVGLMPHPEHAIDPLTGPSADGLGFFTSVLKAMVK